LSSSNPISSIGQYPKQTGHIVTIGPRPDPGVDFSPGTVVNGLPTKTAGFQEAINLLSSSGGGTAFVLPGKYVWGPNQVIIPVQKGGAGVRLEGLVQSPSDVGGIQIQYSGNDWAVKPAPGQVVQTFPVHYFTMKDLAFFLSGSNYTGGINLDGLDAKLEGVIQVRGNTVTPVKGSVGLTCVLRENTGESDWGTLLIEGFDTGFIWDYGHITLARLKTFACSGVHFQYGVTAHRSIDCRIESWHAPTGLVNADTILLSACTTSGQPHLSIGHFCVERNTGTVTNIARLLDPPQRFPGIVVENWDNQTGLPTRVVGQYSNISFRNRRGSYTVAVEPAGFSVNQPGLPTGTGNSAPYNANGGTPGPGACFNNFWFTCIVYLKDAAVYSPSPYGTALVDPLGKPQLMGGADRGGFELPPGWGICFNTAVPPAWRWWACVDR